jgi:hypothetical protein
MRNSCIATLAAALVVAAVPSLIKAQARSGLTASIAAGPSLGFRGDYHARGGLAGTASLAGSVWTTSSLGLTLGLEAFFSTSIGVGSDACVSCQPSFPSLSGVGMQLGWIAGRSRSAALFSGALGVGRLAARGATGLGIQLQAGATVPFNPTWALSLEGRAARTPRRVNEHLIVGAFLVGLRWHPNGY